MATLDYDNKLIGIANNTDKTTWGGIAHRNNDGAFLAVQERRLSNSSSKALAMGFETLCTCPSRVIHTYLCTPFLEYESHAVLSCPCLVSAAISRRLLGLGPRLEALTALHVLWVVVQRESGGQ